MRGGFRWVAVCCMRGFAGCTEGISPHTLICSFPLHRGLSLAQHVVQLLVVRVGWDVWQVVLPSWGGSLCHAGVCDDRRALRR